MGLRRRGTGDGDTLVDGPTQGGSVQGSESVPWDLRVAGGSTAAEGEEVYAYRMRLRVATASGAIAFLCFMATDYLMTRTVGSDLGRVVSVRLVFEALLLIPVLLIRYAPLSRVELRIADCAAYGTAAVGVCFLCLETGGLTSQYYAGIMLVHVCRSAFLSEHYRDSIAPALAIVAPYPVVLALGGRYLPAIGAQWHQEAALAQFWIQLLFILCNAVFVGVGGHAAWSLRRRVYESRALGRYRLERKIGSGGMGEVWSATHPRLRRSVAVKVLHPLPEGDEFVARFEREVAATSRLAHPNTIRVYDYGATEDGILYYVMELLEGESLGSLVTRHGPLPPARAIHLVEQAARALAEAHQMGIYHRDVKPENLFVTRTSEDGDFVKLLDFGVVKMSGSGEHLTRQGAMIGTPEYLSPEAALGRAADARSDVYALGAVLYFCLTAESPFAESASDQLLFEHVNVRPIEPSTRLGSALPRDLEQVVLQCLEKDPRRRFQDAGALAAALSTCVDFGRWSALSAGVPAPGRESTERARERSGAKHGPTLVDSRSPASLVERLASHPVSSQARRSLRTRGLQASHYRREDEVG